MATIVNDSPVSMKFLGWRRLVLFLSIASACIALFGCSWLIPATCVSMSLETAINLLSFILHGTCMAGGGMIGWLISEKWPVFQLTCNYCGSKYELDSVCECWKED
jgi:hypothetical protein